jgi:hypothetical protein
VEAVAVSAPARRENYWSNLAQKHGRSTSRPSKSDRADTENSRERPHRGDVLSVPLTERDGVPLREEVRDLDRLDGDRPVSWRQATREWRRYIEDSRDTDAVFQNAETGDYAAGSDPHRFAPEYAEKQYAKLKDLERGLRRDYGKRLHTAMLSLTASWCPDGEPLPPVDHLNDLDEPWDAVRRELSRRLESKNRWEYLAILEPHESGYLHIHVAVFVDGVVTESDLAPVVRTHVRNCPHAGEDAHDVTDDSTISINRVGLDRRGQHAAAEGIEFEDGIGNLATYLAEYLGSYGEDPLEAPEHQQMANAVLWATGKQRWRPSQESSHGKGAQSYMASFQKESDESPWKLVGIRSGTEWHPCEDATGGVERFVTSSLDPPPSD